jgi:hypothetical protein
MTAGQGPGPYGNPAGTEGADAPQGWDAPQGQPPYGQPPYGQPPYGQYPGYAPAPSAPTGHGAPAPVERPLTVRAGIGAFVGSIVLSLVGQVITMLNWDTMKDYIVGSQAQLEGMSEAEADAAADAFGGVADAFGTAGLVLGVLFTGVFALFVWFAWRGHNWARIVLWVLAGLGLIFGVIGVASGGPLPVLTALAGFELLFDAVAVVALGLKPSNEWYRYRGWLRATGQPG